jgi:hypothetical protein
MAIIPRMKAKHYQFPKKDLETMRQSMRALRDGRIGPPLLLWFLGVPGSIVLVLWFFFFRG